MWDFFCASLLIGVIAWGNIWANRHKIAAGYYSQPQPAAPEDSFYWASDGLPEDAADTSRTPGVLSDPECGLQSEDNPFYPFTSGIHDNDE